MSTCFAASTTSVPLGTLTCRPSMVRVTVSTRRAASDSGMGSHPLDLDPALAHRAPAVQGVRLVLVAEVSHRGHDHPTRRVPQAAEATAVLQRVLDVVQDLQVGRRPLATADALEGALGPV